MSDYCQRPLRACGWVSGGGNSPACGGIAQCDRLRRHVGVLPDDGKTLSKLVSLTDERFEEMIDNGTINSNMGRENMEE